MPITQDYLDALTKQIFIRDYILNGLFPCQSDIVKAIRSDKREWNYNHRFEYRMLLATSNSGSTLNSAVYNRDFSMKRPGGLDYGLFQATYGSVTDGFNVDMMANLETKNQKAAFMTDYAMQVHSMRVNVASLFKNFAIHGRFGVAHRLNAADATAMTSLAPNTPVTLRVPLNVYASGFKKGRLLTRSAQTPWGTSSTNEVYVVIDNQPKKLTLKLLPGATGPGTSVAAGDYLEVYGNRTLAIGATYPLFSGTGMYDDGIAVAGTGTFSATVIGGTEAGTGAMEGMADLLPWYTDTAGNRLGLDTPFRGQPNRLAYQTEQAGGWVQQAATNETIMDAIMSGVELTMATVPYADVCVWMNPETRLAIGFEEAADVTIFKQIAVSSPIIYQRGVTATSYTVGSKVIPDVISDYNLPTDVVVIGPKNDISYNAWDNATMKIDSFIQETFSKEEPPKPEELSIPAEFATKLDIASRITYGAPIAADGRMPGGGFVGGNFMHPGNYLPVAFHEMGALFTENPYAYTIVKLKGPIIDAAKGPNDSFV
jgi:hypothetical protein